MAPVQAPHPTSPLSYSESEIASLGESVRAVSIVTEAGANTALEPFATPRFKTAQRCSSTLQDPSHRRVCLRSIVYTYFFLFFFRDHSQRDNVEESSVPHEVAADVSRVGYVGRSPERTRSRVWVARRRCCLGGSGVALGQGAAPRQGQPTVAGPGGDRCHRSGAVHPANTPRKRIFDEPRLPTSGPRPARAPRPGLNRAATAG